MIIHLTINCKDLDELKSAKATIDRLVEEMEGERKEDEEEVKEAIRNSSKFFEQFKTIGKGIADSLNYHKLQPCGDEWQCHNCGTCNAGKAAHCMGCGK